jgi:hypothetical protein
MMLLLRVPAMEGVMNFYIRGRHIDTSFSDDQFYDGGVWWGRISDSRDQSNFEETPPSPNQDLTFPPPTLITNIYATTSSENIAMAVPPIKLHNSFAKIKISRTSKNSSNSRTH